MSTLRQKLIDKFRDKKYRQVYTDSFLDTYISTQIRALREDRRLSQTELAKIIGTTQPGVSAFENTDYSSWSIRTLRKLAAAFDLALVVKFESFGNILDEITSFSRASLSRHSFEDDPTWHKAAHSPELTLLPGDSINVGYTYDFLHPVQFPNRSIAATGEPFPRSALGSVAIKQENLMKAATISITDAGGSHGYSQV